MSFVLETKYPATMRGTLKFYFARSMRIYPLWFLVFGFVFYFQFGRVWLNTHYLWEILSAVFLFGSDWAIVLSGGANMGGLSGPLGIGWTLGAELTFYLLAPFLCRSRVCFILALVTTIVSRLVINWEFGNDEAQHRLWSYFFFPSTLIFFLMGHMARRVHAWMKVPAWLGWTAVVGSLTISTYQDYGLTDGWWAFTSILLFAFSLPTVFAATSANRFSNAAGDLTYPLYLTHMIAFGIAAGAYGGAAYAWGPQVVTAAKNWPPLLGGIVVVLCFWGFCLIVSVIALYAERTCKSILSSITGGLRYLSAVRATNAREIPEL